MLNPRPCKRRKVILIWIFVMVFYGTVPFNSVRQSRVTGPSKSPKYHVGHGNFYKVPKSFCDLALKYRNFLPPAVQNCGKSPNVTVSLGGCRNQNFVRRVTRHMGCRTELNGTVPGFGSSSRRVRKVSAWARSRSSSLRLFLRVSCSSGWSSRLSPRISSSRRGSESALGFSGSFSISCRNSSRGASACCFGEAKWIHY